MLADVVNAVLHDTGEETEAGEGVTCHSHPAHWWTEAMSPPLQLSVCVRVSTRQGQGEGDSEGPEFGG